MAGHDYLPKGSDDSRNRIKYNEVQAPVLAEQEYRKYCTQQSYAKKDLSKIQSYAAAEDLSQSTKDAWNYVPDRQYNS